MVFGWKNNVLAVKQVDSYYPFGMIIKGLSTNNLKVEAKHPANEYLYNGKMFQDELGLDWLDYGARFYDAVLGRWHVPDPMVEEHFDYTPFAYVYNNPISFIDLFGLDTTYYEPELAPVEIIAKRDRHAETMNNPIVQAVHQAQNDFVSHPLGHVVVWGWSYVVPIPFIEKGISLLLKPVSKVIRKTIQVVATRNSGKNLIRIFNVGGKEIWVNSGHGFETVHATGSFSTTNLTMDQIEGAILKDIETCISTISKNGNNATIRSVNVDGVNVGYKVIQSVDNKISVSTYYPNPTR